MSRRPAVRSRLAYPVGVLALIAAVAACGAGPSADATRLLRDAGAALKAVKSLQMSATFGPGATLQGVELASATARVRLPSESYTVGKVRTGGAIVEPAIITSGDEVFVKLSSFLPFVKVQAADAADYPTGARLFNPDTGIAALLPKGRNSTVAGSDNIDGQDCDRVIATFAGADLHEAFGAAAPTGDVKATIWIARADHLVRRARLDGNLFESTKSSYIELNVHDYNAPVAIPSPS